LIVFLIVFSNIRIDHKESEEKLFKLVVRKHSDGDTIVRHFNPVLVTDEHFIFPASIKPRLDVASLICAASEGFFGVMV
jgi:hypothetical protein